MAEPRRQHLAAVATALLAACGSSSKGDVKGPLGQAVAEALGRAITAAGETVEPWRCARFDAPTVAGPPAGWTLDGTTLRKEGDGARIAVIADARGGSPNAVAAIRAALDAEPVDVLISLGGIGFDEAQIAATLAPLVQGAPWLTIAVPADRESVAGHRAAIASLAGGALLVDGSQIRFLEIGGVVIGTLPGAPHASRLGAGTSGCVHDAADVDALLTALLAAAGDDKLPVLAIQRAPRGSHDLAPGGIHAGDPDLAAALAAHPVELVIHGSVDDASSVAGKRKRGTPGTVAVGALDATPRYRDDGAPVLPSAVIVSVGEREVAWKPVVPRVIP